MEGDTVSSTEQEYGVERDCPLGKQLQTVSLLNECCLQLCLQSGEELVEVSLLTGLHDREQRGDTFREGSQSELMSGESFLHQSYHPVLYIVE